jgi:iron complex transport system substrate-binding protein
VRALAALVLMLAAPLAAAPVRVASLNLCSDELALRLAAPGQMISISRLGADPDESVVAGRATGLPTNRGRVTDVIGLAPDLVLTSGGDPNAAAAARRLGIAALELPQPQTIDDVRANVRRTARALGRVAAGEALIAEIDTAIGVSPRHGTPALLVGGGGLTIAASGLAAQWLAYAGLIQQDVPRGAISLERLLSNPPQTLVIARYRSGQVSGNQNWLAHPALAALPARVRRIETDGRAWTCLGPALAREIARLRSVVAR